MSSTLSKRRKFWLTIASVLALAGIFYLIFSRLLLYTSDAYVNANWTTITPAVAGFINTVPVQDNQQVKQGDLLLAIDPALYQQRYQEANALWQQAKSKGQALTQQVAASNEKVQAKTDRLKQTETEFHRYQALLKRRQVSQAAFDQVAEQFQVSQAELAQAQRDQDQLEYQYSAQANQVKAAQARLAQAQYYLSQTRLLAPASGYVTNLRVQAGEYVKAGQSLFSIVDTGKWWIIANYKESAIAHIHPGQAVKVWLDMYPGRLFNGRVVSIGKGVSRSNKPTQALPYIKPNLDWIRFERRFPVRIAVTADPDYPFYLGSNARTFINTNPNN
jgi:multidrug resistance efflux pump